MKKRICVVTSTRADYGILKSLMTRLKRDKDFDLKILVTGTHLSSAHGSTYKEIENDGFTIDSKVQIFDDENSHLAVAKATGLTITRVADELKRISPELVVVLGDRFEILGAATAAFLLNIPIAHLHGGELTEGNIDDSMRHAITKLSHLHFTATEEYRKRVVQMGEQPTSVHNVGALGLDAINELNLKSAATLSHELNFEIGPKTLLITFHPETLSNQPPKDQVAALLTALDKIKDVNLLFTAPNADVGGNAIRAEIESYCAKNSTRAKLVTSLGSLNFLSASKAVGAVVGNSSSGIIEAPFFGTPTVNIGDRQRGRLRAKSIVDCEVQVDSITNAINKVLGPATSRQLRGSQGIYGDGRTGEKILNVLRETEFKDLLRKRFYNLQVGALDE